MSSETQVKEYRDTDEFNRDAAKMTRDGWEVVSQSERTQRPGCMRIILTAGFTFIFPPKPHVVVTYRRAKTA